jgi:hypothetical protein
MALDDCPFDVLAIFGLGSSFNRGKKRGNPCVYNKSKKILKVLERRRSEAGMLEKIFIGQCVIRSVDLM